jgi:hypothetical protein
VPDPNATIAVPVKVHLEFSAAQATQDWPPTAFAWFAELTDSGEPCSVEVNLEHPVAITEHAIKTQLATLNNFKNMKLPPETPNP